MNYFENLKYFDTIIYNSKVKDYSEYDNDQPSEMITKKSSLLSNFKPVEDMESYINNLFRV